MTTRLDSTHIVAGMNINLTSTNDKLRVGPGNANKFMQFEKQSWLFSRIMNVIAYILPSCFLNILPNCCQGSIDINAMAKTCHIRKYDIINTFNLNAEDMSDFSDNANNNATQLKLIAQNYFYPDDSE